MFINKMTVIKIINNLKQFSSLRRDEIEGMKSKAEI